MNVKVNFTACNSISTNMRTVITEYACDQLQFHGFNSRGQSFAKWVMVYLTKLIMHHTYIDLCV